MAPFEPPGLTQAKNKAWRKVAKADFRDPDVLWTDYWTRFNTISIPIQDEDAFFADAMAAARIAENRQHLEEILEQKSRERRAELADIVSSIAIAAISLRTPFDTPTARSATLKVGQTGSLDSFVQVACGVAFAWNDANSKAEKPNIEPTENRASSAEAQVISAIDIHDDTNGDADEETYDTHDTHDTQEDDYEEAYMPTGDPWELENAFPSEMYDVYEAGAGDERGSEYYDYGPQRVVEIGDKDEIEPSLAKLPYSHADEAVRTVHEGERGHDRNVSSAGRSTDESIRMGPTTAISTPPQDDQPAQIPSSPLSNELSFSGTGSVSSQPPSPVTPRTSSIFAAARIANDSTISLHPESPTTSKARVDLTSDEKLSGKTQSSTTSRKRSLSIDSKGVHSISDHRRKRRAVS